MVVTKCLSVSSGFALLSFSNRHDHLFQGGVSVWGLTRVVETK